MKKVLSLFIVALTLVSCQDDVQTNDPGFQGLKDDVMWRSNDTRAYLATDGSLTIEALTAYEQVTLNTSSTIPGTYILGSSIPGNSASYVSSFNDVDLEYATIPVAGPVYSVILYTGGSGYTSDCDLQTNGQYTCASSHNTTGGSGAGLTVALVTNSAGVVTSVARVTARGNNYLPGDIVTVSGGNVNCKLKVVNVSTSNGEIEITDYDDETMTVSGKFKFNAVNVDNNPFGGPILNFQYGEFYNIPVFPEF